MGKNSMLKGLDAFGKVCLRYILRGLVLEAFLHPLIQTRCRVLARIHFTTSLRRQWKM